MRWLKLFFVVAVLFLGSMPGCGSSGENLQLGDAVADPESMTADEQDAYDSNDGDVPEN